MTYSGTSEKYSSALRALFYSGDIDTDTGRNLDDLENGVFQHYGIGLSADFYRIVHFDKIEWRVAGLQLSAIRAFGDFTHFRQDFGSLEPDSTLFGITTYRNLNPADLAFVLSLRSELVITSGNNTYGAWLAAGVGTGFVHGGIGIYYETSPDRVSVSNSITIAGGHFYSSGVIPSQFAQLYIELLIKFIDGISS